MPEWTLIMSPRYATDREWYHQLLRWNLGGHTGPLTLPSTSPSALVTRRRARQPPSYDPKARVTRTIRWARDVAPGLPREVIRGMREQHPGGPATPGPPGTLPQGLFGSLHITTVVRAKRYVCRLRGTLGARRSPGTQAPRPRRGQARRGQPERCQPGRHQPSLRLDSTSGSGHSGLRTQYIISIPVGVRCKPHS